MPRMDCIVTTEAQYRWIQREFGLVRDAFRIGSTVSGGSSAYHATFMALANLPTEPRPVNMFGYHREEITPMNLP